MRNIIQIADVKHLDKAAKELLDLCKNHSFFAFYGNLGAGKTTFIKHICKQLNCKDNVVSPTFSLINEYQTEQDRNQTIYHMDFYRLESLEEALNIGVEEYMEKSDAYCFIEWPELIEQLLPENTVSVEMQQEPDNSRTITISING